MIRRFYAVAIFAVLVTSLPALSLAQERGMMMHQGQGHGPGWSDNPLDLSTDQMEKIRSMRLEFQKQMIGLRADMQSKRLDLVQAIESKASQDQIGSDVDALTAAIGDVIKTSVNHWNDVRGVLTAEQQSQLDNMMGPGLGMGWGMGHGMGMGMMGGGWMGGSSCGMGQGCGMGMMGGDDREGRGWGRDVWRGMCPRWW
jgi:hypothetical protein